MLRRTLSPMPDLCARCARGVFLAAALLAGGTAAAQGLRGPLPVLAQMEPEQRRMMRDEMREHWRQVPPEDRQRLREERRERWQQMPPEDRQRLREDMRGSGFRGGPGGGSGGGHEGHRGGRR